MKRYLIHSLSKISKNGDPTGIYPKSTCQFLAARIGFLG